MLNTRTPLSLDGKDFETTAKNFQSKLANLFCSENPIVLEENVSSLLVNDEGGLFKGEGAHSATDIIIT